MVGTLSILSELNQDGVVQIRSDLADNVIALALQPLRTLNTRTDINVTPIIAGRDKGTGVSIKLDENFTYNDLKKNRKEEALEFKKNRATITKREYNSSLLKGSINKINRVTSSGSQNFLTLLQIIKII